MHAQISLKNTTELRKFLLRHLRMLYLCAFLHDSSGAKIFARTETCISNYAISPFFSTEFPRRSKTLISHSGRQFILNYWTLRRFRPRSNKLWLKQRLNVFS